MNKDVEKLWGGGMTDEPEMGDLAIGDLQSGMVVVRYLLVQFGSFRCEPVRRRRAAAAPPRRRTGGTSGSFAGGKGGERRG